MRHGHHDRRAYTLIEVVLAMGLLAVLSSLLYWFYASSLATRHEGVLESQKLRLSRIVLERIVGEIRQAAMVPSEKGVAIRGDAEQIRLTTIRTPDRELYREHYLARTRDYESRRVEYDIVKVTYHIVRHPAIQDEYGDDLPIGSRPQGVCLRFHAGNRIEQRHSASQYAERAIHFYSDLDVSRRVDDVDLMHFTKPLPLTERRRRRNRDAALLLLLHPIHRGGTVVDFAKLVRTPGVVENPLGRGGLTRIYMRHDPDIADLAEPNGACRCIHAIYVLSTRPV